MPGPLKTLARAGSAKRRLHGKPREKADFDKSTAAKDEEGRIRLERLFSAQFHAHVGGDEVFVSLVGVHGRGIGNICTGLRMMLRELQKAVSSFTDGGSFGEMDTKDSHEIEMRVVEED
jgi:hypothetical protein